MTLLLRDAEVDDERTVIRADVRPVAVGGDDHPLLTKQLSSGTRSSELQVGQLYALQACPP